MAKELSFDRDQIVVDERLYATSVDELLAVARSLDQRLGGVMLVGHSLEMSDFAQSLSIALANLPTCAVANSASM